ncbi:nitrate- and nitrite sensing domain-containing protein [Streptomyces sp. DSM 44917]|uniref:histidine kinase n=1 Tax=Streptomyces boetiae TaxID=3075541 RepID=A0ABU2L9S9_9ACTN|nr:nitrate- and nitrite sensing domain-containing protein [Streptomyces sp. DSM 44917]MDT0308324.1 nitrate- and nitrite sensing domain-containing protein [Streptomyces sp. DSM 44917]
MTRRRTGLFPHWGTIRGRVAIVLAVPTCLLLALAGAGVADRAADWSAARESRDRVQLALDVQDLVRELQREHGLTSGLLVGAGSYRPELADTRRRVDAIRGGLARRVDEGEAPAFEQALASLSRLTEVRGAVDEETVDAAGLAFFSEAIDALNDAQLAEGPGHGDARLADGISALQALSGATSAMAEERGVLNGVFVSGRFTGEQYLAFASALADRQTALDIYQQFATPDQRAALREAFETEEAQRVGEFEERATAGSGGDRLGVDPQEWWEAATALTDALHDVQQRVGPDIENRAAELRSAATRELAGLVALGLVILGVAIALALLASRSITRPLDELTSQAEAVAGRRLPDTVRAIQEAEPEEADRLEPPEPDPRLGGGAEEVSRLAAALHDVERAAVSLAAQQTVLRRNGTESLANLGHRNQALVRRQLRLITALESKELDPDALAELFELDHLATRMRRNADSLLILTGQQLPPRVWTGTAEVAEVVRSAVSEVEDYRRVALVESEPCQIHGRAVYELSHLLAELIENALTASPPGRPVEVYGWWDGHEYCLAVVDRGTGMTEEELARANARMAGEENFLVAPTRFLGHYVVGTIAARLGVQVEVRHTQSAPATPTGRGAGVSAYVALPARLLSGGSAQQRPSSASTSTSVPA